MFKSFLSIFLVLLLTCTICTGNVFAFGYDIDIPIDDEDEEIVIPPSSNVESFEHLNAGNVKVDITNSSKLFTKSGDAYKAFPVGPAPSGDKWGMFTNYAYPTYKLVDGEYVTIENPSKKGTYCGDNMFPIKAIKGDYTHTYYADYKSDQTLLSAVTVTPHSGNTMIGMGQMYRTGIKAIENLEPFTDYELSIWVYQTNTSGYVKSLVVADNYDGIQTNGLIAFSDTCNVLGASNYSDSNYEYGKWEELTVSFSTTDKTTAYLHISQNGLGTDGNKGMIFLDDLSVQQSTNDYITGKELIENNLVTTQGATTLSGNALILEYSADGFSFTANCEGTVSMNLSPNVYNSNWDLRLAIHINSERKDDIVLTPGITKVVLAYGLEKGDYTFKVEKMTEASIGKVLVNNISLVGEMKIPPAKAEMHIDFYGDSITAGWGTTAYNGNPVNPYQYMDGTITYAAVASKILGANFSAFGYSGWGVAVTGEKDGKGDKTMTTIYPDLPKNPDADVVVIALGTNDANKYQTAGLTEQQVKDAYLAYVKNIRRDYGRDTHIVFAYGMMTDGANGFIEYAVDGMKAEGDNNVYSVRLPKGTSGGAGHPNSAEQSLCGETLAEFIKEVLKTYAGDIDGDKAVNLNDLVSLAQYVAKWENVWVSQKTVDVNDDGVVDLTDVSTLAKYLAGWPNISVKGDIHTN